MTLADWVAYLERQPTGLWRSSLAQLREVAERLGGLHPAGKVILVGGSNGKGSTVAYLESLWLAAGFRVGGYFSPHLFRYQERIRLNGKVVSEQQLVAALAEVERARGDLPLSYFDFTTLAALRIFQQAAVDFTILEVGLGGRLDATNIMDCDLAIITSVDLEHVQILGNTRELIGKEKAGILRPLKPLVGGRALPESVQKAAQQLGAPTYSLGRDFDFKSHTGKLVWFSDGQFLPPLPWPRLAEDSAALALMALQLFPEGAAFSAQALAAGLNQVQLPGRLLRLNVAGRDCLLDVAHNPAACKWLAERWQRQSGSGKIHGVLGVMKDKDLVGIVQPFMDWVDHWYLGQLQSQRAMDLEEMAQQFDRLNLTNYQTQSTITSALQQAFAESREKDTIAIFGSFWVVAEAVRLLPKLAAATTDNG